MPRFHLQDLARIRQGASQPPPGIPSPTPPSEGWLLSTNEVFAGTVQDGIPAIDDPQFYDAVAADQQYTPGELVLGVDINGERRAYSTELLNHHEIVNDVVAGQPIAVTW